MSGEREMAIEIAHRVLDDTRLDAPPQNDDICVLARAFLAERRALSQLCGMIESHGANFEASLTSFVPHVRAQNNANQRFVDEIKNSPGGFQTAAELEAWHKERIGED